MLNRKILGSIIIIGIVAISAVAGTWAYYRSSADIGTSIITSGTVSLALENGDFNQGKITNVSFERNGALPGDTDVYVKTLKAINRGNVPARLFVKAVNIQDAQNLGKYLTIKVDGKTIYSHGTPVEAYLIDLDADDYVIPIVTYSFEETGQDQSEVMGGTFTCDLLFTLKSV